MDQKRAGPHETGPMPTVCVRTQGRSGARDYRLKATSVETTVSPADFCSCKLLRRPGEGAAGGTTCTVGCTPPAVALGMRACPKWKKCSAPICPLDEAILNRKHLPGERVCIYLLELVKPHGRAKIRGVMPSERADAVEREPTR